MKRVDCEVCSAVLFVTSQITSKLLIHQRSVSALRPGRTETKSSRASNWKCAEIIRSLTWICVDQNSASDQCSDHTDRYWHIWLSPSMLDSKKKHIFCSEHAFLLYSDQQASGLRCLTWYRPRKLWIYSFKNPIFRFRVSDAQNTFKTREKGGADQNHQTAVHRRTAWLRCPG